MVIQLKPTSTQKWHMQNVMMETNGSFKRVSEISDNDTHTGENVQSHIVFCSLYFVIFFILHVQIWHFKLFLQSIHFTLESSLYFPHIESLKWLFLERQDKMFIPAVRVNTCTFCAKSELVKKFNSQNEAEAFPFNSSFFEVHSNKVQTLKLKKETDPIKINSFFIAWESGASFTTLQQQSWKTTNTTLFSTKKIKTKPLIFLQQLCFSTAQYLLHSLSLLFTSVLPSCFSFRWYANVLIWPSCVHAWLC